MKLLTEDIPSLNFNSNSLIKMFTARVCYNNNPVFCKKINNDKERIVQKI